MKFKENNKLLRKLTHGAIYLLLSFVFFDIAPNKIDYDEYLKAREEYETNFKILKSKYATDNNENSEIKNIKEDIEKLNKAIKDLKLRNNIK